MKKRPLNTRQKRFIENHILKGMSIAESVRRAGYMIKSGRSEDFSSLGCRLLKTPRVADEVKKLRERVFEKTALSFSEKRNYLARVVRSDATAPDPDLVQEIREEVDAEGNVKRVRKMVSKLEALNIDNKMIGHEHKDREVQASNPFLFLINLSKPGASLVQGDVAALPALPAIAPASVPAPVIIDAELVE